MTEFFRFPRTPHLVWLGAGEARDDKVLGAEEASALLDGPVLVEEKVDGANLGISVSKGGSILAQNRGAYIERDTAHPQFRPLFRWLDTHRHAIADALGEYLILFGEWCYAVHSVRYTKLPDWFVAFDVYDRERGEFWSAARRDELTDRMGAARVPTLAEGYFALDDIVRMLGASLFSDGPAEGVYVRRDDDGRLAGRAKVVRPEFVQQIDAHWSGRSLQTNTLVSGATW
jgi:ATP-dependent RNA circularization protein (DNA/RNA ligase family)